MQIILGTIAIIISFIYACFSALFGFLFPNTEIIKIRENLDMNIKPYYIEFHEDTRGWFGDGEEIIIFRPNQKQIEKIETEWKKTPVDSGIAPLIFPENEYNGLELTKYIPKTEGFWFYKNRNEFHSGYSYNFSFAFFDGEKVYYYELDT
ncbi:MAG: hypothetical protein IJO22_07475 [Oscillospiraceae bacterium]|nr:hypothetical protein [Oscillospiraceae bacterium]